MKNIILGLAITVLTLVACNTKNNKSAESQNSNNATLTASSVRDAKNTVSIKAIISAYLQLKNAFTTDNTTEAANAGKALQTIFKNYDQSTLTASQKKTFEDVVDDASEHAEHIGKNGGNIKHQREHFELLSKDIYDLIKAFGAGQVLYKDFDQMYNKGKGAFWISETKEIRNPYMGKAMLNSGKILETIK